MDDVKKRARFELMTKCDVAPDRASVLSQALSDAGLLLTPLHERALEAVKAIRRAEAHPVDGLVQPIMTRSERAAWREASLVGRDAIEAERPKDVWEATQRGSHWYANRINGGLRGPFTEAEAQAVAKALNELPR